MAKTNSQIAYEYYISQGMSPAGAAGIVGNLFVESGVNPRVTPGDGGIARGIAQWHPDRWERWVLRDPLNTGPGQENELQTQLHASVAEMKSMGVWNALKGMTDPGAAARYVNDHYEISASRNGPAPNRVNAAHEAFDN